jgi:hypothetical protein
MPTLILLKEWKSDRKSIESVKFCLMHSEAPVLGTDAGSPP